MRPPQLTSTKRGTYRDDHGTPNWMIDLVKRIHGYISVDLASTARDNARIEASRFFSRRNPCPAKLILPAQVIYCNPPGPGWQVCLFWNRWCSAISSGAEGAFLFFSADHMRCVMQHPRIKLHVMIPHKRLKFHGNKTQCSWVSALVSTKPPRLETDWLLGHWLTWESH